MARSRNPGKIVVKAVRRKRGEKFRREYIVQRIAANGRHIPGGSGESWVRRGYAVNYAKKLSKETGAPIFLDGVLYTPPAA